MLGAGLGLGLGLPHDALLVVGRPAGEAPPIPAPPPGAGAPIGVGVGFGLGLPLDLLLLGAARRSVVPPPPAALAAPSLVAQVLAPEAETQPVAVTIAGPASWPVGTTVQLEVRRGADAWAAIGAPTDGAATLTLTREATPYALQLRAIAWAPGTPPLVSEPSGVLSFVVPARDATGIPLACRVRIIPSGTMTGVGVVLPSPAHILRGDEAPNTVLVDRLTNSETLEAVSVNDVASVRLRLEHRMTRQVVASAEAILREAQWRGVLRHSGLPELMLAVDLVPVSGATTRYRFPVAFTSR